MALGRQQEDMLGKRLRRQLAAAVHSIQWSYGIFWSGSNRQPGMLEWRDGYYNGDIKTRKMTQSMELKADHMGLQRSEQLRQLYMSLSAGDSDQMARRPSPLLSPEDLSDSEWYYMVCMSFTFHPGHGLVGRTIASGTHIWLTDAHSAESKIFTRSLLAKSAAIETVFCCPLGCGVLELGTTEIVSEDPELIRQVTTSFRDFPSAFPSEQSLPSNLAAEEDEDQMAPSSDNDDVMSENPQPVADYDTLPRDEDPAEELDEEMADKVHSESSGELKPSSHDYCSNDCCSDQPADEFATVHQAGPGAAAASGAHSWQLVDDDLSCGLQGSLNSSEDKRPSLSDVQLVSSPTARGEKIKYADDLRVGRRNAKLTPTPLMVIGAGNWYYGRTLPAIFGRSAQVDDASPLSPNGSKASSFRAWRNGDDQTPIPRGCARQKILKKILSGAGLMPGTKNSTDLPDRDECDGRARNPEGDHETGLSHLLAERRRREGMNKKFLVLKSLLPSIGKIDKASILGDTIEYLKELERRVESLETYMGDMESRGARPTKQHHPDVVERTSDNYGRDEIAGRRSRSSGGNKRKARDAAADPPELENHWILTKDGRADVNVTIIGKEVSIQMSCRWRDCLLLEIVDAVSTLHLDAHSVQSSTADGNLTVTIKSQFRGAVAASPGMIKAALRRVISKC